MGDAFFIHVACILVLIFKIVIPLKHFSLLENGENFNWYEASYLCRNKNGHLVNGTHLPLLNITEEENLLQTLLNVSDTWTSLRLVNGYMKETGLNDDLIHGSNDLWYQKESYSSNLCVKITKTNKLQTVQCTTQLPVVCEFETFYRNKSDTIEHKTANVVSSGKSSNEHVHSNDDNFAMTTNKNSSDSAKEEMASFHVRLSRMKRQNQQIDKCPPNYYLHNSYCVRETEKATWSNAYQDCFRNAIEKTPLDIEGNLENLNFINTLLEKLEKKGIKSIWLAAQRKIGGGPIVYSGPIDFKFNYDNHSTAQALNITWNKHINYNNNTVTNECLVLNILQRTLEIHSCDILIPFVCIFPSLFWTQHVTYDSFCKSDNSNNRCVTQSWTWEQSRANCRQSDGKDLVYMGDNESLIGPDNYIGKQNTKLSNTSSMELSDWLQSNSTDPLFCSMFMDVLHISCKEFKIFGCLSDIREEPMKLVINRQNQWNEFMVTSVNMMDISHLYGIRCFLNGKLIKKDMKTSVTVRHQGYLFCEVLTHNPVQIIKSDSILVENPHVLTYICKISVEEQYNTIHDFTFGADLYYKRILEVNKLSEYNVTVLNITYERPMIEAQNSSTVNIEFQIEVKAGEDKIQEHYNKLLDLLNVTSIGNYHITMIYLRSVQYCIPKDWKLQSDCNLIYSSRTTRVGRTDMCIQCNKIVSLACIGSFSKGAVWEVIRTKKLPELSPIKNTCSTHDTNTRNTLTMMISIYPEYSQPKNKDVTRFIKDFEDYFFGREQNTTGQQGNASVTIYSTSAFKGVRGFYMRQGEKFRSIGDDTTDLFKENITAALYLNYNSTSVLIAHFKNPPAFPYRSGGYRRVSPVFMVNVSSIKDVSFPIQILVSLESENVSEANLTCGFWNETTNQWDTSEGDRYEGRAQNGLYNCSYFHLTAFTLLVSGMDEDNQILDLITKIGCTLSLTGSGLVCLVFLTMHKWTKANNDLKLLFFLSVSLFFMYLSFLIGVPQTSSKEGCTSIIFGVLLHYFALASFCWMFAIAYHNYLKFVKLFDTYIPKFMWKVSSFSWCTPAVPVIVICSINSDLYKQKNVCWLHSEGFTYGFLLPLSLIVLSNLGIYVCILINVWKVRREFPNSVHNQQSLLIPQIVLSLCLFVTLGLSWVFGVPAAVGDAGNVFSYLFCISSTAQGFLVFVYFFLMEKKVRLMIAGHFSSCLKQIQTKFCRHMEEDVNPLAALDNSVQ